MFRCQYSGQYARGGEPKERCDHDASHRVQIGMYAGSWRLCEPHVGVVIERASADPFTRSMEISVDAYDSEGVPLRRVARMRVKAR